MLIDAIARLEETIEAETGALLSRQPLDREEFNRRKSQSLLELTRLLRARSFSDAESAAHLERLRSKLEVNQTTLGMHLRAVQEVADVISGAIRHAESDGTYSPYANGAGAAR